MTNQIQLQRCSVPYETKLVHIDRLAFYPENPRIDSRFPHDEERSQEAIQLILEKMEHVKELRSQIDRDGQVNEPLYCISIPQDSDLIQTFDYQVLEGNSRLAALRMTGKRTSLPPSSVSCNILNFSGYTEREKESLIFSLLSQFHIAGRTNWESYENAAYIYRRHKRHGMTLQALVREMGLARAKIQKIIEAFELMMASTDRKRSNWSYYEAYVSSSKIRKHRENDSSLDERVCNLIREDKISRAADLRDKLPAILGNKAAKKLLLRENEESPFEDAAEVAQYSGDMNSILNRIHRFRKFLGLAETKKQIRKLQKEGGTKGRIEFEMKKLRILISSLEGRKNQS